MTSVGERAAPDMGELRVKARLTGAVRVVLPPYVVVRLGLAVPGQRVTEYAEGGETSWVSPSR